MMQMEFDGVIQEIVSQASDEFANLLRERRELPRTTLVHSSRRGSFKVRLYPSEEAAKRKEQIVLRVRKDVPMPMFVGRDGPYLVFQYLPLDGKMPGRLISTASSIGIILRNLSKYRPERNDVVDLDGEFRSWLNTLLSLGYLSQGILDPIWQRYQEEKPDPSIICLDHWDAMFHNFGQNEDQVYLLDEKHLRFSYACVSLVKPSLLMEAEHFKALLDAYGESDTLQFYNTNRTFLRLYYLIAALYFYAQKQLDGSTQVPANPRLRYYRGSLVRMVWRSPIRRIVESLAFTFRYPGDSVNAFLRRISGPLNVRKLIRRLWLDVKPWDEDAF